MKFRKTIHLHSIDKVKRPVRKLLSAAVALLSLTAMSAAIPPRPEPARLVNDFAGILTPRQAWQLERALVAFDDSTSNQIAVVTVADLEGYSSSEYATRIGLDWNIGSADHDNGIVVLVKPKTGNSYGDVAISVGYGLEGAIPDAYCKRIIDNEMIPRFAEGDYYSGIAAGCKVLMQLASGEISEPREDKSEFSLFGLIISIFLIKPLNAFLLGERYAQNLGIPILRSRFIMLLTTGLLTAIATAFCGPISFIGLAVPHISRLLSRSSNHNHLLPLTILLGGIVTLFCNFCTVAFTSGTVIPINVITPLMGAPVILYVIINQKRSTDFS